MTGKKRKITITVTEDVAEMIESVAAKQGIKPTAFIVQSTMLRIEKMNAKEE